MHQNCARYFSRIVVQQTSFLTIATILISNPCQALDQVGAPAAASAGYGAAAGDSAAAGAASEAAGTSNMQQGNSTQNQAQVAMGAMQILMGLLGMLASMAAAQKGGQSGNNASGMSGLGGDTASYPYSGSGTSPTGSSANNSGTSGGGTSGTGTSSTGGTNGVSAASVGISPSDLRTGQLGTAMDALQNTYGLNRDQVVAALQNGTSPQDILANAPKNAPSADLLNRIADGLASSNTAGQDAARNLASSSGSNVGAINAGGASAAGTPAGDKTADSTSAAAAGGPKAPAATSPDGDLEDAAAGPNVSPEVKAALATKAAQLQAEKDMRDMATWNLFQLVHNRYKKLETMLYGRVERTNSGPTAGVKGF